MATDRPYPTPRDIALATALLTRLPVPVDPEFAQSRGARAAWAYPLAGAVLALIAGAVGWIALAVGLPASVAVGLALAVQIIFSGAMHEDGLADSADGLWGGWEKQRRLEIMKDSRIGTYGVVALVLSVGLRWSALTDLALSLLPAMVSAALLSRGAMLALMAALPNSRDNGLSRSIGRPTPGMATFGVAVALAASVIAIGPYALMMAAVVVIVGFGCAGIARAKIGGQTGDILGATQQVTEIAALATACALLG